VNGGPATSASLYYPSGVAVDAAGNLYISSGSIISKVLPNGASKRKLRLGKTKTVCQRRKTQPEGSKKGDLGYTGRCQKWKSRMTFYVF